MADDVICTFLKPDNETITRTVTNMPVQGKIRIVKTDSETGKGLPGAVFTVTRISGLPSHYGENDGEIVAVITSGADGTAETPLLTWGEYQIVETRVPDDYLDDGSASHPFPNTSKKSKMKSAWSFLTGPTAMCD